MKLVKLLKYDGEKVEKPVWHAVSSFVDESPRTLCFGEVYDRGDTEEGMCEFREKTTGKVTCPLCIEILKDMKTFKY